MPEPLNETKGCREPDQNLVIHIHLDFYYLTKNSDYSVNIIPASFLVHSPKMTCKTGQMSVHLSINHFQNHSSRPRSMKLGMYILWVVGQNFWEAEF